MRSLLSCIIGAGLGLWLATILIVGVGVYTQNESSFFGISLHQSWQFFILFGIVLGSLNYFIKPILNLITLPLRIITLGLFTFIINMSLVWIVDSIFSQVRIPFFYPLFWTTVIIFGLSAIMSKVLIKRED